MTKLSKVTGLLTRDEFREAVFARDGHKCVICGSSEGRLDAHHIMNRRLWDDDGYYLANGATLCTTHHQQAEMTVLSCEDIRLAAAIDTTLIPEHLAQDEGERYDVWGNQIMPTGVRLKGELFNDVGCQRMLKAAGLLSTFAPYVKFGRTMHTPNSPNLQNNDRRIKSMDAFVGHEVVITEKRDGENTSLYPDYFHARSIDSKDHPSRAPIRALHGAFKHEIPVGWRITGENLYARHSIPYTNLTAFFEIFAIWDETNTRLSWDEMEAYCGMLGVGVGPGFERGLPLVPVLYRGPYDEAVLRHIEGSLDDRQMEGYVITRADRIHYAEWRYKAAKYVRAKHVQTDEHWSRSWIPNSLCER